MQVLKASGLQIKVRRHSDCNSAGHLLFVIYKCGVLANRAITEWQREDRAEEVYSHKRCSSQGPWFSFTCIKNEKNTDEWFVLFISISTNLNCESSYCRGCSLKEKLTWISVQWMIQ